MRRTLLLLISLAGLMAVSGLACAQDAAPQPTPANAEKKPLAVSPSVRLASAKTVFMKNGGGSDLPFNVINGAIESWGRYLPVDSPEKADLVIEVSAPNEGGVSIKDPRDKPKNEEEKKKDDSGKQLEVSEIKMIVTDPRSRVVLWAGREQTGFAVKQKAKTDKIVEASQRLFTKFHDRVEPPPAQP